MKKLNIKIFLILIFGLVIIFLNALLISGQKPNNSLDDIYVDFHSVSEIRQGYIFPVTLIIRNLDENEVLNIKKITIFDKEGKKIVKIKKINKNLKPLKKSLKRGKELRDYLQSPEFCESFELVEAQPEYKEYVKLVSKIKKETFRRYFKLDIRDFDESLEVGDIVNVSLDIEIKIGNEKFMVSRENQIEIASPLPAPLTFPSSSFGWYKGDLHIHSGFGETFWGLFDPTDPLEQMVSAAKLKDLDWVIFTDHSVAFSKASEWEAGYIDCTGRSTDSFKCLYGQEMSIGKTGWCNALYNGHYLAYPSIDNNLGWIDGDCSVGGCVCNAEQPVMNEINQAGGMGFIAHPHISSSGVTSFDWDDWSVTGFTGLEIINGDWSNDDATTINNPGGENDSWEEFLQAEINPSDGFVVGIGGSDAHTTNDVGYGAFVYCYMDSLSTTNIRNAIKDGHCVVSVGPFIEFTLNGAMIGDEVNVFSGINTLNISADSTGFGNLDNITILIDGVVNTVVGDLSGTFYSETVEINLSSENSYVRVEVYTDAADDNCAFTNPIWVNVITLTSPSPNINSISATPALQGFGENVTITADIVDINGVEDIDKVLVGITPFGESQTNYTMNHVSEHIWQYKFTDFTNGTYTYTVYVNDSTGLTDFDSGTFEMYVDLFINIQTLKDNYVSGELVKITDPPDKEEKKELEFETEEIKTKNINDIVINDKFAHLKGFKQVGFSIDYDNVAIESFDKEIFVPSSEEKLKNKFRAESVEVESVYEEVDGGFFNVDERPVKQTYVLKNLLDSNKNVKLNIMYEIDSDFVIWNGTEYSITNEPVYFEAFEVTEEMFPGLNETFLTGHTLYFGNNYYDFKDVVDLDYAVSVYSLGGRNYINLEVNGEIDGLSEFVVDPVIGWTTHVIAVENQVRDVFAIDLDRDGDIDVLSSGTKIMWYENNGHESFTKHTIGYSDNAVFAIDLDSDGDIDVLSADFLSDKIEWYENDGNEVFTTHVITTSANAAYDVYAIDVDSDGDIDVLSANYYDARIVWYENDGNEIFTTHNITTSANGARSVYAIDLDNDNDIDILSANTFDDKIVWYENDGSESFTPHIITTSADGAKSVFAIDVDSDGDVDVLSASYSDYGYGEIAWYENYGNEVFAPHTIITTFAEAPVSVYAIDVDSDGDIDVLSSSGNAHKIEWYENDGGESFTPHTITGSASGAGSVFAIDLDSDGDIDVLSASFNDDKIAWYESDLADDESKIRNDGVTNVSVYLLMKVQYWNGAAWVDEVVINDGSVPIRIQPGEDNQLKLDAIWNPNAWDISGSESGTYRVYVAVTDEDGVVLEDVDGSEIEDGYGFGVV